MRSRVQDRVGVRAQAGSTVSTSDSVSSAQQNPRGSVLRGPISTIRAVTSNPEFHAAALARSSVTGLPNHRLTGPTTSSMPGSALTATAGRAQTAARPLADGRRHNVAHHPGAAPRPPPGNPRPLPVQPCAHPAWTRRSAPLPGMITIRSELIWISSHCCSRRVLSAPEPIRLAGDRQVAEGFEPLTPSMRKAYCAFYAGRKCGPRLVPSACRRCGGGLAGRQPRGQL